MTINSWDVFLIEKDGSHRYIKCIDTVFFHEDCDAQYVHTSLINDDGYNSNIIVRNNTIHRELHGESIEDYAYDTEQDDLISMYCWPKNNEL